MNNRIILFALCTFVGISYSGAPVRQAASRLGTSFGQGAAAIRANTKQMIQNLKTPAEKAAAKDMLKDMEFLRQIKKFEKDVMDPDFVRTLSRHPVGRDSLYDYAVMLKQRRELLEKVEEGIFTIKQMRQLEARQDTLRHFHSRAFYRNKRIEQIRKEAEQFAEEQLAREAAENAEIYERALQKTQSIRSNTKQAVVKIDQQAREAADQLAKNWVGKGLAIDLQKLAQGAQKFKGNVQKVANTAREQAELIAGSPVSYVKNMYYGQNPLLDSGKQALETFRGAAQDALTIEKNRLSQFAQDAKAGVSDTFLVRGLKKDAANLTEWAKESQEAAQVFAQDAAVIREVLAENAPMMGRAVVESTQESAAQLAKKIAEVAKTSPEAARALLRNLSPEDRANMFALVSALASAAVMFNVSGDASRTQDVMRAEIGAVGAEALALEKQMEAQTDAQLAKKAQIDATVAQINATEKQAEADRVAEIARLEEIDALVAQQEALQRAMETAVIEDAASVPPVAQQAGSWWDYVPTWEGTKNFGSKALNAIINPTEDSSWRYNTATDAFDLPPDESQLD